MKYISLAISLLITSFAYTQEPYPELPRSHDQLIGFIGSYLQAIPGCVMLIDRTQKTIQVEWTGKKPLNPTYQTRYHQQLVTQLNMLFRSFTDEQVEAFFTTLKTAHPQQIFNTIAATEPPLAQSNDQLIPFINNYLTIHRECKMYIDVNDQTIQIQWTNRRNGFYTSTMYEGLVLQKINRLFKMYSITEAQALFSRLKFLKPHQIFTPFEGVRRQLTRTTVLPTEQECIGNCSTGTTYDRNIDLNILFVSLTLAERNEIRRILERKKNRA